MSLPPPLPLPLPLPPPLPPLLLLLSLLAPVHRRWWLDTAKRWVT
jgi:hypothetical protein